MDVIQAIEARRAYRSLKRTEISAELVNDLAECAKLSASCFNKQPWRFVFVYEKKALEELKKALNQGNAWAKEASMIIAVCTKKELDCVIKEREYALFDTGMAAAFLILRATELGLVAHPIAGYDHALAKTVLGVPPEMTLITLMNVGQRSETINPVLNESQAAVETARPERLPFKDFAFINRYQI